MVSPTTRRKHQRQKLQRFRQLRLKISRRKRAEREASTIRAVKRALLASVSPEEQIDEMMAELQEATKRGAEAMAKRYRMPVR